jgi:hypothetical protein
MRIVAVLAMVVGAAAVGVAADTPAWACIPDPATGKCVPPPPVSHPYQVTGADSQGLAVESVPHLGHLVRWATNGTTLNVTCQVNNGDQADGRTQYGRPFTTWDELTDGNFVYDWYMNTPTVATDGYSPGMPHCPTSNPTPPGGGAGTYQVTGTDSAGLAVHSAPTAGGILRYVPNGTSVTVSCQINDGAQVDGRTQYSHPFTTWDQLSDGTFVYDWYLTTAIVATDGYSPGMPHCRAGSVQAFDVAPDTVHIFWTDPTNGNATYLVTDGYTVRAAGRGAVWFDWDGLPEASMTCFKVSSALNGYQTPWSTAVCATTNRWVPWCPPGGTHPVCDNTGAFQISCDVAVCDTPVYDYGTVSPTLSDDAVLNITVPAAITYMASQGWLWAPYFFNHYLENNGKDLPFSSSVAYHDSPGFAASVDATAASWIGEQRPQDSSFDSGYIEFPPPAPDGSPGDTGLWGNTDWQNAVGHGFYRLAGTRTAGGSWSVSLQVTSLYQFRKDQLFGKDIWVARVGVTGEALRHLEKAGKAENYREVGTGTLSYDSQGHPL